MEDKQKEAEISDEELFQIFKSYDLDNNGLLDHDEIKKALEQFKIKNFEQLYQLIIHDLDKNHDGFIEFSEFKEGWKKLSSYRD